MALRCVLRPYTLGIRTTKKIKSENFDRFFDFVHQKVGKP